MGNIFAASEVVELGIQIEKNGMAFYNALTGKAQSDKSRQVFKYLAGEEEKHIGVFQKILEKCQAYEPPQIYADDYTAYMRALASDYIFTRSNTGSVEAGKVASDAQAVAVGMKFEKDSIIFYEGIKKVVPGYDHKAIDELIAQEQAHFKQLAELNAKL